MGVILCIDSLSFHLLMFSLVVSGRINESESQCGYLTAGRQYLFYSAVGLNTVRLKDKENFISGGKLSYLN